MDKKQPKALRLAEMLAVEKWQSSVTVVSPARECVAELLRQHAENETLRAGYAAARLEVESLKAQLHAAKQINAAQFRLLAASIPGSALRASHGQAPAGAGEPTEQQILEAAFAPAQPAPEASRFGSPELQAMIIARCVEKDQADSVPAVSDLPPLPAPDLRDVGTKPQEIKEFLKGYATEYARTAIAARAPADSVQEDAALLDWLEQHDGRYYNLDKVAAIVGTGFLVRSEGNMPQVHSTLREAVGAARKQGEKQ